MEDSIRAVLEAEKIEKNRKLIQTEEEEVDKAKQKLKNIGKSRRDAISESDSAERGWFQTPKQRKEEEKKLKLGEHTKLDGKIKVKIPSARDTAEDRVQWELQKAAAYQVTAVISFE